MRDGKSFLALTRSHLTSSRLTLNREYCCSTAARSAEDALAAANLTASLVEASTPSSSALRAKCGRDIEVEVELEWEEAVGRPLHEEEEEEEDAASSPPVRGIRLRGNIVEIHLETKVIRLPFFNKLNLTS